MACEEDQPAVADYYISCFRHRGLWAVQENEEPMLFQRQESYAAGARRMVCGCLRLDLKRERKPEALGQAAR